MHVTCVHVCVMCVCVCVCVCVFILFCLLASSNCKTFLRCSDQRVFLGASPSSLILNLSYFISKDGNSSSELLERKRYDIILACEKIIYIDIGYKSAQRQRTDIGKKILKIRRLLESKFFHIESCPRHLLMHWGENLLVR